MHDTLDLFRLDGKVALLVGGASDFGAPIAGALARAGADVAIADLHAGRAEAAREAVAAAGRRALVRSLDATDKAQAHAFVAHAEAELGAPSVLVNLIAAPVLKGPSEHFDDTAFLHMLDVNVRGMFVVAQAAFPAMHRAGSGSIILFSSTSGVLGQRHQAAYTASKGAVNQLTRTLALEWAPTVRVNAIAPTWFMTRGLRNAIEASVERGELDSAEGYFGRAKALIPMQRMGTPKDLAGPLLFLASDASAMVTGHILLVDGGMTLGRL